MMARLFNVPSHDDSTQAMGTSTVGSSEAIMLAVLAMKKRWQNKRKAEGKPCDKPNMIMNSAVQVCVEKSARYFDIEEKVRSLAHIMQFDAKVNCSHDLVRLLHGGAMGH